QVTARSDAPDESANLIRAWYEAYYVSVVDLVNEMVEDRVVQSAAGLEERSAALAAAEDALSIFDRENNIALDESRLSGLQGRYVSGLQRKRELESLLIPRDESQLEFLRSSLSEQSLSLGTFQDRMVVPSGNRSSGTVTGSEILALN